MFRKFKDRYGFIFAINDGIRYIILSILQVHIGLTQGSVELENLKLREDALENFNLPFKIVDGKTLRYYR